jgi:hypothetical protein
MGVIKQQHPITITERSSRMATPRLNAILDGLSGQIGNVVFSERYGKTVISRKRGKNKGEPSAAQLAQQEKFTDASQYAKAVMADPQARIPYVEAARTVNTPVAGLIMEDYLRSPKVSNIDLSQYTRQPGGKILIRATDDFEVTAVAVTIKNGQVVESGAAVKSTEQVGRWVYTATAFANGALTVEATASDRPGNKGAKTETIN